MNTTTKLFTNNPYGSNELLEGEGFFISYNCNLAFPDIPGFSSDLGSDETAIVLEGKYFILNDDYRFEYAAIVDQGLNACLQFFIEHAEQISSWSNSVAEAKELMGEKPQ